MDATSLTWQWTGAVACIAMHLARWDSLIVAHLVARGTAFNNRRPLASRFPLR
jgi:hypothetical protein